MDLIRRKRKPRVSNKLHCEKIHAIKRLRQRYYIYISISELDIISSKIRKGESVCVGSTSLSRTVHLLEIKGIKCLAIYDNKRHTIVTFLPSVEITRLMEEME
jgi:hypothetical protein